MGVHCSQEVSENGSQRKKLRIWWNAFFKYHIPRAENISVQHNGHTTELSGGLLE